MRVTDTIKLVNSLCARKEASGYNGHTQDSLRIPEPAGGRAGSNYMGSLGTKESPVYKAMTRADVVGDRLRQNSMRSLKGQQPVGGVQTPPAQSFAGTPEPVEQSNKTASDMPLNKIDFNQLKAHLAGNIAQKRASEGKQVIDLYTQAYIKAAGDLSMAQPNFDSAFKSPAPKPAFNDAWKKPQAIGGTTGYAAGAKPAPTNASRAAQVKPFNPIGTGLIEQNARDNPAINAQRAGGMIGNAFNKAAGLFKPAPKQASDSVAFIQGMVKKYAADMDSPDSEQDKTDAPAKETTQQPKLAFKSIPKYFKQRPKKDDVKSKIFYKVNEKDYDKSTVGN